MKAIETTATINESGQLRQGKSLGFIKPQRVTDRGIILTTIYSKSDISDVSNETIEEAMPTAVNYAQYEQEIQIADNSDA